MDNNLMVRKQKTSVRITCSPSVINPNMSMSEKCGTTMDFTYLTTC